MKSALLTKAAVLPRLSSFCWLSPGAQSDSELSPHHVSQVNVDRGYTSDSEVYAEHSKARIPRSTTDVDVASSGWLVVSTHARARAPAHAEANMHVLVSVLSLYS